MKYAVYTSCNLYYLDRAVLLANTLKQHFDCDFYLMLSDYADKEYFSNSCFSSFDFVIDTADIGIPDFKRWSFQYEVVELCTAVKGYCLNFLFERGYDSVIYFDPDIAIFGDIQFLFDYLETYSIILTPHMLSASTNDFDINANELSTHKHGIFNLGFLGVSNTEEGRSFSNWWASRLRDYCLDDIPNGMFTDQKWCDAVPSYFSSFKIVRHPGCNMASWNLYERDLEILDDRALINNEFDLIFYHFTKYFSVGTAVTMKYASTADVAAIWYWYGREILKIRDYLPQITLSEKYNSYTDGVKICRKDRIFYRNLNKALRPENPYESRHLLK